MDQPTWSPLTAHRSSGTWPSSTSLAAWVWSSTARVTGSDSTAPPSRTDPGGSTSGRWWRSRSRPGGWVNWRPARYAHCPASSAPAPALTPDDEGYPGRDDRTGPVLIADPADPRATTETAGPNDLPSSPSVDFDAGPVDMVTGTGPVDMVTGTGPADTATDAGRVETRPQAPLLPTLSIRLPSDSDAGDVEPAGAAAGRRCVSRCSPSVSPEPVSGGSTAPPTSLSTITPRCR